MKSAVIPQIRVEPQLRILRARRIGVQVVCASNLRALVQAAMLHAKDHGDYLPLAGHVIVPANGANAGGLPAALNDFGRKRYTYAPTTSNPALEVIVPFTAALAPQLSARGFDTSQLVDSFSREHPTLGLFKCPAVLADERMQAIATSALQFGDGAPYVNMYGGDQLDYAVNGILLGFDYRQAMPSQRLAGRIAAVRRPAQIVLLTDARPDGIWMVWRGADASLGPLTLADALGAQPRVLRSTMFDRVRHQGRINAAFLDGHVEHLRIAPIDLRRAGLLLK